MGHKPGSLKGSSASQIGAPYKIQDTWQPALLPNRLLADYEATAHNVEWRPQLHGRVAGLAVQPCEGGRRKCRDILLKHS